MTVQKTTLDNGITVLSEDYPHLETVALGVWMKAGARDEHQEENGIAHMLEHMAFKGTSKRNARQIVEEIEAAGGDLNAATSMESTTYNARVLKGDWPGALDVLGDIVCDPLFDADELARERDVVLQEIAAANDTPDDVVYDLGHAIAFPDQAVGRAILGTQERVAGFTAQNLINFRKENYNGSQMVIAAAGRIDHHEFADRVAEHFSAIKAGTARQRPQAKFSGGMSVAEKPLDQTHILMSFPTIGYRHDDIYAMQVLSIILGGGMSSRLFQQVREERGLCYAVYAHVSAFQDSGLFSVYAGTAPDKVDELVAVTSQTIATMTDDVATTELERAKNQIKAGLVMSLESSAARADQLARQFMAFGKTQEISHIINKIEEVTLADISRLADEVFCRGQLSFAAVGSLVKLPEYEQVLAGLQK